MITKSGVYVHIPFCARLCPYCAFPVAVGHDAEQGRFVEAVLEEASGRAAELPGAAASLHFGGGTPSRLDASNFRALASGLKTRLEFGPGLEFAMEANPEDVCREKISAWTEAGVNRVSLGAQSFDEDELRILGRAHGAEKIRESVALLREGGLANINLDLIAGAAEPDAPPLSRGGRGGKGLEKSAWFASLEEALSLDVEHISFYILEYEPGTEMSRRKESERWTEDAEGETLLGAAALLQGRAYEWYELSNFAKASFRSRYNDNFWKGGDLLGLGPGAASSLGATRRRNPRNLKAYLEDPCGVQDFERLDPWSLTAERLLRGLRGQDGVNLENLAFRSEVLANAVSPEYRELVRVSGGKLLSTVRGRLLADGLARDLMPPRNEAYIHEHEPLTR